MRDRLAEVQKEAELDWQEFSTRAKLAIESTTRAISTAVAKREKHDAEQTEVARLRREDEERKASEREQQIIAKAAEEARKQAEERAARVAKDEADRVHAEQVKADQERSRIQREKEEAEQRAAKAEADRVAAVPKQPAIESWQRSLRSRLNATESRLPKRQRSKEGR